MSFKSGKKISVFLHLAAWIILFLLPIYLTSGERSHDLFFVGRVFVRTTIYILLFYISYTWLIPHLFFKGRRIQFYLTLLLLIVGLYFVNEAGNRLISRNPEFDPPKQEGHPGNERPFKFTWKFDLYNYLFTTILISGFSLGLKLSGKYNENEKKRKELEKEKISSELAFLKNQVSPHFFFNTLNNIYSLTEINTQEAQNAILKLSKMMRYLLYESEKGDVRLSSEIAFMKNYIELMKLRVGGNIDMEFNFPEDHTDILFPPLLFISFIENAFKHGVSFKNNSFIRIDLRLEGKDLIFRCINSISAVKEDLSDSGIGLENVKKRLFLLFPENHSLQINKEKDTFEVLLSVSNIV